MELKHFLISFSLLSGLALFFNSCASGKPQGSVYDYNHPTKPDYANPDHWAALPDKEDKADLVPHPDFEDLQESAAADVFFLHPTTYLGKKGEDQWNAPIDDPELNEMTEASSIKNQASIFNGAGRVFAPRYRQAHYDSYFTSDTIKANKAFRVAYLDVKAAFDYYMKHYNNGRPIIIAAHSQGTNHGAEIIKTYFDGKAMQDQLIVAYLVGMPIKVDYFKNIKVCETPEETGCFCSWRTWKKGHFPENHKVENNIAVTNPLSWTTDPTHVPKEENEGSVIRKFEKSFYPGITDAKIENGVLWISKPKFPGSFFVWFKNYHIADFNLFYANVRKNAQLRVRSYLKEKGNTER